MDDDIHGWQFRTKFRAPIDFANSALGQLATDGDAHLAARCYSQPGSPFGVGHEIQQHDPTGAPSTFAVAVRKLETVANAVARFESLRARRPRLVRDSRVRQRAACAPWRAGAPGLLDRGDSACAPGSRECACACGCWAEKYASRCSTSFGSWDGRRFVSPEFTTLSQRLGGVNREQTRETWRRGWDSNPRTGCPINGFRDRPIRPLWHLSWHYFGGEGGIRTHG
jgi:hypothetical protein